jgi:hypothetical protein
VFSFELRCDCFHSPRQQNLRNPIPTRLMRLARAVRDSYRNRRRHCSDTFVDALGSRSSKHYARPFLRGQRLRLLKLTIHKTNPQHKERFFSQAFDIWYNHNIIMSFTPPSLVVSAQHTSTSEMLALAAASSPHQHRELLATGPALVTVAIALLLLGMILGAGLFQCYSERGRHRRRRLDASPSRSSSASRPAKQAMQQPAHPQIEESVIDVYTTTEEYNGEDDDGDDDSTTATRAPRADTRNPDQPSRHPRHSLPEDSYLSEFSNATEQADDDDDDEEQARPRFSSRDGTSYGGDEVSFAGYSISAALDAGTTLPQLPSFRRNNNNNNDRRRSESVTVGSSSSFFAPEESTSTIQTSHILGVPNVQRIVTAPPGRLGLIWQVGPDGPTIEAVKTGSPLEDQLFVGDIIIAMNGTDLRSLTSWTAMQKVLEETNGMQRIMTVLTKDDVTRNHHRRPRKVGSS